jgi:DNA gyrase/topoisomerase IV subunit B
VNSSLLYDGGLCNTQFSNAFTSAVISHLEKEAKKLKSEVTKSDVTRGLLILGNLKLRRPEYDSQAKTRLTGPNLRTQITSLVESSWSQFGRRFKDWLGEVLQHAVSRYHHRENQKAIKAHKQTARRIEGLIDATSPDRQECILFITEGLSARSTISEARNPKIHASFPLTGKINNVYGATPAQVLKMEKVADLLAAIGLTPGVRADPGTMRYGKIVLSCDADTDGAHITSLLVQLFYQFWPELFNSQRPKVFRLMTPNVVAPIGGKRVHYGKLSDVPENLKASSIEYMKGLGSLQLADWKQVLADLTVTTCAFVEDGKMKDTMKLHFSESADDRKRWLTEGRTHG